MGFGSLNVQIECFPFLFPPQLAPSPVFTASEDGSMITTHCLCQRPESHLVPGHPGPAAKAVHLFPFVCGTPGICRTLASRASLISIECPDAIKPQGLILIILKFTAMLKEEFSEHRVFFCLDNLLPCLCPVSIFLSHLEVRCIMTLGPEYFFSRCLPRIRTSSYMSTIHQHT